MYQKGESFTTTSLTAPPSTPYDRDCPIPRFLHDLAERPRGVAVSTETHSAIADLRAVSRFLAVVRGPLTPRCGLPRSRSSGVGVKSLLGAGPEPGIEHRTGRLGTTDSRTSPLFGGSSAPRRFVRRAAFRRLAGMCGIRPYEFVGRTPDTAPTAGPTAAGRAPRSPPALARRLCHNEGVRLRLAQSHTLLFGPIEHFRGRVVELRS